MDAFEAIDRQLQRLYDLFVVDGELNADGYAEMALPLEQALLEAAKVSAKTTEDATQTGPGGEQSDGPGSGQ